MKTRGVLFFIKRTCSIHVKYRRHLSITSNMLPVVFISYISQKFSSILNHYHINMPLNGRLLIQVPALGLE